MLVVRVQAVGCEIARLKIILKVIKGCYDRVVDQGRPSDGFWRVEAGVKVDRNEGSQESREYHVHK